MSYPDISPTQQPRSGPPALGGGLDALASAMRSALVAQAVLTVVIAVVAVGVGWLIADGDGIAGALVGAALAAGFFAVTAGSVLITARAGATTAAAVIMGSWLLKLVVLIGVLALLAGRDFYHPGVLLGTLAVTIVGTLAVDTRAVLTARVPYVEQLRG